jgi:hypothetical protein
MSGNIPFIYISRKTQRGTKMQLVSLSDETALKQHGIFYRPGTLRRWYYTGEQPQLFKKIRRRLFIDLCAWQDFLKKETGTPED